MKKAIFFDIDGTLIDCMNGKMDISDRVKNVIKDLQKNGDYVFIATGRPYALVSENILNFGFDGLILSNGAHILINNETIYSEAFDKEFVNELVNELENNKIEYILQGEVDSYLKDECKNFYEYYEKIGVSKKYLRGNYNLDEVIAHKIEMLCPTEESKELCLSLIKNNEEVDYFSSVNKSAIEVYMKKNNKANAILKAIEHIGVDIKNTYAFGDGKNDIEMLLTVNCGIAMGNASDEVKKYANEITDCVENDGVAIGIESYVIA